MAVAADEQVDRTTARVTVRSAMTPSRRGALVVIVVAGLCGAISSSLALRSGPVLAADSYAYVGTADNVLHRHSLTIPFDMDLFPYPPLQAAAFDGEVPLSQWPPVYPLVLAALGLGGMDLVDAARCVNVAAVSMTCVLFALVSRRLTGSVLVAIVVGACTAFAPGMVSRSTFALTEPLFLALTAAALWLLLRMLATPTRGFGVALAAVLFLATGTRFIGIALVPVVASAVIAWTPIPRRRRSLVALGLGVAGVAPVPLWLATVRLQGAQSLRQGGWYPIPLGELEHAATQIVGWFSPVVPSPAWSLTIVVAGATAWAAATVLLLRLPVRSPPLGQARPSLSAAFERQWVRGGVVLAGSVVSYVAMLLVTMLLLDAYVTPEPRHVVILFPALLVAMTTWLFHLFRSPPLGRARRIVTRAPWFPVAIVVLLAFGVLWPPNVLDGLRDPTGVYDTGPSYPALAAHAERIPPDVPIISNLPAAVWFATDRPVVLSPVRRNITSEAENRDLQGQIDEVGTLMRDRHAVLVDLPNPFAAHVLTAGDLAQHLPIHEVARFEGGSLWEWSDR